MAIVNKILKIKHGSEKLIPESVNYTINLNIAYVVFLLYSCWVESFFLCIVFEVIIRTYYCLKEI